jgi:hypothetical protein
MMFFSMASVDLFACSRDSVFTLYLSVASVASVASGASVFCPYIQWLAYISSLFAGDVFIAVFSEFLAFHDGVRTIVHSLSPVLPCVFIGYTSSSAKVGDSTNSFKWLVSFFEVLQRLSVLSSDDLLVHLRLT